MKKWIGILVCAVALLAAPASSAQEEGFDVFIPIAKYIAKGDAVRLSAWFADNLEISVISQTGDSSRNQARQILKSFFV